MKKSNKSFKRRLYVLIIAMFLAVAIILFFPNLSNYLDIIFIVAIVDILFLLNII